MHILEIPSFFPPHGGDFCIEQARALQQAGHEVRILACVQLGLTSDRPLFWKANTARVWKEVEGIPTYFTLMRGIPKCVLLNERRWVRIVCSMYAKYVSKYGKPDVIHAHCAKWAGVAAHAIAKREGIPYYITEHLSSVLYEKDFGKHWEKHIWARHLLRTVLEQADCVIPVAEELVDDVADWFGRDYRYHYISNTIDTDFFAYKERNPLGDRPYRFCMLARADVYAKGFDVLSKAWKQLETTDRVELHIAGRNTDQEKVTRLFAGCEKVIFHGMLDKNGVRDLLYESDCLVLPSRSEVQPLVVLEAISTGIPVVSTEVVPQCERIANACSIVPIGDADSFLRAMKEVIGTGANRVWSAEVSQMASPVSVAKKLEQLFAEKQGQRP